MGTDEDTLRALVSALPSLADSWVSENCGPVVDAGKLASHLITLMADGGAEGEIGHFFAVVEKLLISEPPVYRIEDVRNWVLVEEPDECGPVLGSALIEGIQNITSGVACPVGSSAFIAYLGPKTLAVWQNFHEMWGTTDT